MVSHPSQSTASQGEKRHPVNNWAEAAQGEQRLQLLWGQTHALPFVLQLFPAALLPLGQLEWGQPGRYYGQERGNGWRDDIIDTMWGINLYVARSMYICDDEKNTCLCKTLSKPGVSPVSVVWLAIFISSLSLTGRNSPLERAVKYLHEEKKSEKTTKIIPKL